MTLKRYTFCAYATEPSRPHDAQTQNLRGALSPRFWPCAATLHLPSLCRLRAVAFEEALGDCRPAFRSVVTVFCGLRGRECRQTLHKSRQAPACVQVAYGPPCQTENKHEPCAHCTLPDVARDARGRQAPARKELLSAEAEAWVARSTGLADSYCQGLCNPRLFLPEVGVMMVRGD